MARIFFVLSIFTILLLVIALAVGFSLGDYVGLAQKMRTTLREYEALKKEKDPNDPLRVAKKEEYEAVSARFYPAKNLRTWHFYCGVIGALATVLLNSISVTYFIGTARWCTEVADAYSLPEELKKRSQSYKRSTFPWSIGAILSILAVVSLGAAADPGANFDGAEAFVAPHQIAAIMATGFVALALFMQVGNIGRNFELIEDIVAEVGRIRAERGLS